MILKTNTPRGLLRAVALALALGFSGSLLASEGEKIVILPAVDNAKWHAECSGCHALFHPALLPERSWKKLMGELDHHFGKSIKLDAAVQKEITGFLVSHAAEHSKNARARNIAKSTKAGETPIRITETPFFSLHHNEIAAEVWQRKAVGSKINCVACHPGADKNNFDEKVARVPN